MTEKELNTTKAKVGDTVRVHFTCKLDDGSIFDTSIGKEPLQFIIGENNLLPGFEESVIGMNLGETKITKINAGDLYGPFNQELVKVFNRSEFPGNIHPEVGLQFQIHKSDGGMSNITVTDVSESSVTLDANHPLAGKDLIFEIELIDILKAGPSADAYYHLGIFLQDQNQLDEAISCYAKAIKIKPDFVEAYYNLGVILHEKRKYNEAIQYYQEVLKLNTDHLKANINLGNILRQTGEVDDAVRYFQKALSLDPDYADIYNNLGAVFQDKGELDEAISYYQKALELNVDFSEAYNNLGMAYQEKGQFDIAKGYFQKALQQDQNSAEAHVNLSFIFLLSGNFSEGWREYEWRLETKNFDSNQHIFQYPFWDGCPLKGKTLLVCAEQGIGEEIMFASCLPDVIAQADSCIVECEERLVPIFERSFPQAKVLAKIQKGNIFPSDLKKIDTKIAIGSLPRFLLPDLSSLPKRRNYLLPDVQKAEMWQHRFSEIGKGLKIGISWRGGGKPSVQRKRSISIEQLIQFFPASGVHIINLQYGNCREEIAQAKDKLGVTIHDWDDADPLKDLDNFAAQIAALDLVISVDNATVHLAGALGKPVWTLVPFIPDWRWMLDREDSPWYTTMRLFRQPSSGDWESVINHVQQAFEDFIRKS